MDSKHLSVHGGLLRSVLMSTGYRSGVPLELSVEEARVLPHAAPLKYGSWAHGAKMLKKYTNTLRNKNGTCLTRSQVASRRDLFLHYIYTLQSKLFDFVVTYRNQTRLTHPDLFSGSSTETFCQMDLRALYTAFYYTFVSLASKVAFTFRYS